MPNVTIQDINQMGLNVGTILYNWLYTMVPKLKRYHVRNVYSNSNEKSGADLRGEGGGGVEGSEPPPFLLRRGGGAPKVIKRGFKLMHAQSSTERWLGSSISKTL